MKIHILAALLSLLLLSAQCAQSKGKTQDDDNDDDDITTLTFLIEYEPQSDNDHITIGLTIEAKDMSLKNALKKASDTANKLEYIANDFCNTNPKEGFQCDEIVDIDDFEINAEYTKRRKELVFEQFVVTQEVSIKVDNTEKIGELGDKILKTQNTKIDSFDWGSNQQNDDEQEAIQAGKKKSQDMCFHLGMKLHRIVSVQAIEDEEDGEQGGQDEEEQGGQEDDQEDGPLVFKFEVECIVDEETARKKELEQQEQDEEQQKQKKQEEQQKKQKKKKQKKDKDGKQVDKKKKK